MHNRETFHKRQEIISNYINAYNSFDLEKMIIDFDENIIFEYHQNGKRTVLLKGLEKVILQAQEASKLFKSRNQTIKLYRHTEETTEIEVEFNAILSVDFNGQKAGQHIHLLGKSIFEFENSKIIRLTDISDSL